MGNDAQKSKNHSKSMNGKPAWNKGLLGLQDWMNTSGLKPGHNKGKRGLQVAWNKGVPNTDFSGEKNPNWKGGVTKEYEKIRKSIAYKQWREAVYKRDNYTCQLCGEKESVSGKLEADHIKQFADFPELRFDVDNGRTLCKDCHTKTDTYLNKGRWKKQSICVNSY